MENKFWESCFDFWKDLGGNDISLDRINQVKDIIPIIENNFQFDKVNCIETGASSTFKDDGAVGIIFAKACQITGGEFHSVDIDEEVVNRSKKLYDKHKLDVNHYIQDSVNFLNNLDKTVDFIPNIVHLDSWDVQLYNPLPCALHGWKEFVAIEDKMPVGSILIVDDNWFKGTYVEWVFPHKEDEVIDVTYPILGKGALIYHHIKDCKSNWVKISNDVIGSNTKIVYKKCKQFTCPPGQESLTEGFQREIFEEREYDRFGINIKPGDIVLDAGGNVGIFTQYAIDKGASKVVAYECDKPHFECYNKNINSNKVNCTLGYVGHGEKCYNIKNILEQHQISHIDFAKIDIEGYEYDFLMNISDEEIRKVKKWAIEFHPGYYEIDGDDKLKGKKLWDFLKILEKFSINGFRIKYEWVHKGWDVVHLFAEQE